VWRGELPSREGWPITWVHSALLARKQAALRDERIARTIQEFEDLRERLASPRSRIRSRRRIHEVLRHIFGRLTTARYVRVRVVQETEEKFRQMGPGRPGANTAYRKITKKRHTLTWHLADSVISEERRHDGMYPLLTNDRALSPAEVLTFHKMQPRLERRFSQLKDPMAIAPVFLKNEARIEAFFTIYALALLVQALMERQVRLAMKREEITTLPIYPERRRSRYPTALQILRLFENVDRHELHAEGRTIKTFLPALDPITKEVLRLMDVPASVYR
jgi:transposase